MQWHSLGNVSIQLGLAIADERCVFNQSFGFPFSIPVSLCVYTFTRVNWLPINMEDDDDEGKRLLLFNEDWCEHYDPIE